SPDARENLIAEGIGQDRIKFVGNVMIDALLSQLPLARGSDIHTRLGLPTDDYAVATFHRPSNVDERDSLATLLEGLQEVATLMAVVVPLHPRTRASID